MKQNYEIFTRILRRSKEYEFNGSVLVLRDYYSGDEIRLDLAKVTPELFEEIAEGDPREEIWRRCTENISRWDEKTDAALETIGTDRTDLEHADYRLYNAIQCEIENYCYDRDIDINDIDVTAEEILFFVPGSED